MRPPAIEGFDAVCEPPHAYYVRPEWKAFLLESLRSDFANVGAADRRAHRGRVEHFSYGPPGAPGRVFVRRAVRAGVASLLGDLHFGLARFLREMRASNRAVAKGVAVPEIVGARLTRAAPGLYRFTLVVREVPDARDLLHVAADARPGVKHRAIRSLGEAVHRMHEAGLYHGDLNLRNILASGAANGLSIHFIDFDKARLEDGRRPELDAANLSRLNRSVEKWLVPRGVVTRTDKLRFLVAYAGRDGARRLARRCGADLWYHRLWWALTGHRAQ